MSHLLKSDMQNGKRIVPAAALLLVTFLLYWPTRTHELLVFDDQAYVGHNQHVLSGLSPANVRWSFTTGECSNWHPLTWLSLMTDCSLSDDPAYMCHITNTALHTVNTLLLLALLVYMTNAFGPALLTAALFALHPLHVESVAWVAERKDVLSTFFWLLTMLAYVRYARKKGVWRYLLVALLLTLGLMAKPMLVTLPCVLLLMDYWPLRRFSADGLSSRTAGATGIRPLLIEKAPLFAIAVLSSLITLLVQRREAASSLDAVPIGMRAGNANVAYVSYLQKTLWPSRLAILYPYPTELALWQTAGAALLLLGGSLFAVRMAKKRPYVIVGWLWYLGTLVPVIGIVQVGVQRFADRYTYIPLIGVFMAASWWLEDLTRRSGRLRRAGISVAVAVCLVLAAMTWRQVGRWRDPVTLNSHALAVTERNYIAHFNLAAGLAEQGNIEQARHHYSQSLAVNRQYPRAHYNMGLLLVQSGQIEEAVAHFSNAVDLNPCYLEALANLADLLEGRDRLAESLGYRARALELAPENGTLVTRQAYLHNRCGAELAGQGKYEEALRHFSAAVDLAPDLESAQRNLRQARDLLERKQ